MSISKIKSKIEETNQKIAELKAAQMAELQKMFHESIKEFFNEVPVVQAVVFTAYQPHWNDGEECIYSVNEPQFITKNFDPEDIQNPYDYEDDEETYGTIDTWSRTWKLEEKLANAGSEEALESIYAFADIIQSNDDMIKEIYGDHVRVCITPTEVFVDEYDHD